MIARSLLDTHILVRWLTAPKKLTRDQTRALHEAVRRHEALAISGITLLEIAVLFGTGGMQSNVSLAELLEDLENNPAIEVLPLDIEIAKEIAAMGPHLKDPMDRAIVATARVHRLRLITSDQRIIDSKLVTVIV